MNRSEFIRRYDLLASEEKFLEIPKRKNLILNAIGRGNRVLDLGCLGGEFSKLIKDQNNDVFGVELNPKSASVAEAKGIRVKVFDLNEGIPFEDGFFDIVYGGEIAQRLFDTRYFLEECNRVLNSRGFLILTVPNLNSLENRIRVLKGEFLSNLGAYPEDHFGDHIRVFNLEKIRELFKTTGFAIQEVVGVPFYAPPTRLGRKLMAPILRFIPQLGEVLIIKARRVDQ